MDVETLNEDEIALVSGGGDILNPPAPSSSVAGYMPNG